MNIYKVARLKEKKHRKETGHFLVEGDKAVLETLSAHGTPVWGDKAYGTWEVVHVYATAEFVAVHGEKCKAKKVQLAVVDRGELAKAGSMEVNGGAIAVVRIPELRYEKGEMSSTLTSHISHLDSVVLALDGIKDPGNLGTILRTADWFGVDTVICSTDTVDTYNPKAIAATMGSFLRVRTIQCELEDILTSAKSNGVAVYATAMKGIQLGDVTFKKPCIIVMGSESHGVKPKLMGMATETITIPRIGKAESLNVGVATGITLSAIQK